MSDGGTAGQVQTRPAVHHAGLPRDLSVPMLTPHTATDPTGIFHPSRFPTYQKDTR